jgi:hypothetical protein
MAWESRGGVGRYYTRSVRVGGRVERQYIGTGPVAEFLAAEDERRRREQEAQRAAWREEREAWDAAETAASASHATLTDLIKASLLARGFHQHNRGKWRRRRGR